MSKSKLRPLSSRKFALPEKCNKCTKHAYVKHFALQVLYTVDVLQ